jgi:isopentenyl phosphate kinase
MTADLIFLKLGGSLITDKAQAETALPDVIFNLLSDLKCYLDDNPGQKILVGHGSGSFGHHAAAKFNTRNGVSTKAGWVGFLQVWESARKLNRSSLTSLGKPTWILFLFSPSASLFSQKGQVVSWNTASLEHASRTV